MRFCRRMSSMDGFCSAVAHWFDAAFTEPSPIQKMAWPKIRSGENCLLLAPTGSGKTFAAFLTLIDGLARLGYNGCLENTIYAIYITPLKALGNDIHRNLLGPLSEIGKQDADFPNIEVAVRSGDTPQNERARMTRKPPHILITTPESLYLILGSKRIAWALESVQTVIVDEVHSLCDNKRGVHLAVSLERLEERTAKSFQRIGCSATMNPVEEIARYLAGYDTRGDERPCTILDVGAGKQFDLQVKVPLPEFLAANNTSLWNSAYEILQEEIKAHDTTLVFCNSIYRAEKTALHLNEVAGGVSDIGVHHGSIAKEVRLDVEARLKAGQLKALLATSSLELGIDIGSVNLVYHLESPKTVASGLQRVGRAGHLLDTTSKGRILIFDRDELVEAAVICRAMADGEVDRARIPKGSLDVLAQQVAAEISLRPQNEKELFGVVRRSYPYSGLSFEAFEDIIRMLVGEYRFSMPYPPWPLLMWDRSTGNLSPVRGATHITVMNVGTIEDPSEYDVVIEKSKKHIGKIESDFVDDTLRAGEVFALGNSSWRVRGKRKNQVLVEEAPGSTPTVPWWTGGVVKRTVEVGKKVGMLRREIAGRSDDSSCVAWLKEEYHLCPDSAEALRAYVRSQQLTCGTVPDHEHLMAENWRDELGRSNVIIHCPLGERINRTWGLALCEAAREKRDESWSLTASNDLILLTLKREGEGSTRDTGADELLSLVQDGNLDYFLIRGIQIPGGSKFRAVATCALQILRAKEGKRVPVWLQNHRAQELFDAAAEAPEYPLFTELRQLIIEET